MSLSPEPVQRAEPKKMIQWIQMDMNHKCNQYTTLSSQYQGIGSSELNDKDR